MTSVIQNKSQNKRSASLITLLLTGLIFLLVYYVTYMGVATNFDIFGYYAYLPLKFIYHDLGVAKAETIQSLQLHFNHMQNEYAEGIYSIFRMSNGNHVIKYTMGWSICYAPFFLIGHLIAITSGALADGYSDPYQLSIVCGSFFYNMLGLFFLRKWLLLFFSERTTVITFLLIVFSSNYFLHSTFRGAACMTHNLLFTFVLMFLYFLKKWSSEPTYKTSTILALLIALIGLIRPTELTIGLLFLFWKNNSEDKYLFQRFFSRSKKIGLMALIVTIFLSFQLIYWKCITGSFFYNSYNIDASEGFDWTTPHIFKLLFSFRKGLFIYTPVFVIFYLGIFRMYKNKKGEFTAILIYCLVNLYVVASWSNWWYAGSYSCRALIPNLAVLALPCGVFVEQLFQIKKQRRIFAFAFIAIGFVYTQFKIWQYTKNIIDSKNMSFSYYVHSFFATEFDYDFAQSHLLLNKDDYNGRAMPVNRNYSRHFNGSIGFEDSTGCFNIAHSGKKCFQVKNKDEYSYTITRELSDFSDAQHFWIKPSMYVYMSDSIKSLDKILLVCICEHDGKGYNYQSKSFSALNIKYNTWTKISCDYLIMDPRSYKDEVKFFIWNSARVNFYMDDFGLESFVPVNDN